MSRSVVEVKSDDAEQRQVTDNSGGEGGIRTLGTGIIPYNGLANRRIRPLCHLSGVRFFISLTQLLGWAGKEVRACVPLGSLLLIRLTLGGVGRWGSGCSCFVTGLSLC